MNWDAPLWLNKPLSLLILNLLPYVLTVLQIVWALIYFRWWMCLSFIPAAILATTLCGKTRNPALPLFVGLLFILTSVVLVVV